MSSQSGNGGPFRRVQVARSTRTSLGLPSGRREIQVFLYPESIIEVVEHELEVLKGLEVRMRNP